MKKVKIIGEAVIRLTHYLDVPDEELRDLLDSEDNLICNIDEENAAKDVIEWNWIRGEVQG